MLLSDYIKNGTTLQGVAGVNAINTNDLLLINALGKLYPVAVSDTAAVANAQTAVVAETTLAAFNLTTFSRKEIFISPIDGATYVMFPNTAGATGLSIAKYSSAGTLAKTVSIDTTLTLHCPQVQQLSNGNLLFVWNYGITTGDFFAIYDQGLNVVVAKTSITASPINQYLDSIPLSGGGFAVAYPTAAGILLAIYTNTGGVTFAGTAITSSPTAGQTARLVQLSNGNIAIAINSSTVNKALGYAISTTIGTPVINYTVLDAATSGGSIYPEIASMTGFFACSIGDSTNIYAAVLNNAGAVQGAAFTAVNSNVDNATSKLSKLMTDGVGFWLAYLPNAGGANVEYLPTTGTGYTGTLVSANVTTFSDAMLDRGNIFIMGSANVGWLFQLNAVGLGTVATAGTATLTGPTTGPHTIRAAGDFAVAIYSSLTAPTQSFGVFKYQNASIVGVSQSTVAANNAGAVVSYSMGAGGYPCNQIVGSLGKSFDHTSSNVVANKGVILGLGTSLRGI